SPFGKLFDDTFYLVSMFLENIVRRGAMSDGGLIFLLDKKQFGVVLQWIYFFGAKLGTCFIILAGLVTWQLAFPCFRFLLFFFMYILSLFLEQCHNLLIVVYHYILLSQL
ncbi:hypothetical protein ACJX0J_007863, partial [Zea mays]